MTSFRARGRLARSIGLVALALLAGALVPSVAQADIEVTLRAHDLPEPTEKNKNPSPPIEAVIRKAVAGLAPDQFFLEQTDATVPIKIKAGKIKRYVESNDKMALVILVQGNETWIGNEENADELGETPTEGAFKGIGPAIDEFARAGPPGSLAAVLVYADGKVLAKQGMEDAGKLSGAVLGAQKDYQGITNATLIGGLDEAMALLDGKPGYRKILVTIGDGTGQGEDIAVDLNARQGELAKRSIESYTIFYEVPGGILKADQQNMKKLGYSDAQVAQQRDNFVSLAQRFVGLIGDRYYATFPGCNDEKPPVCFDFDGKPHLFVVTVGEAQSEPIELQTKIWAKPKPPEESSLWWLWLLLVLLVVGIVIIVLVKRAQNQEPAPMPMPEIAAPPPGPAGPAKTIMLGIGGNDGGMPVVGWIVPLSGPNQYQTYKLLSGVTKIGTGGAANIVINDGFMSTEHAQVAASPTGFVLQDGGSTNGTYVNDKRVGSHELVDNDVITMGKTSFKFKSIN